MLPLCGQPVNGLLRLEVVSPPGAVAKWSVAEPTVCARTKSSFSVPVVKHVRGFMGVANVRAGLPP